MEKDEIRYETLLKLFFGNEADPADLDSHINSFQARIEGELPFLLKSAEILEQLKETDAAHKFYLLTVELGIKTYQSHLEWCEETREILKTIK